MVTREGSRPARAEQTGKRSPPPKQRVILERRPQSAVKLSARPTRARAPESRPTSTLAGLTLARFSQSLSGARTAPSSETPKRHCEANRSARPGKSNSSGESPKSPQPKASKSRCNPNPAPRQACVHCGKGVRKRCQEDVKKLVLPISALHIFKSLRC